MESPSLPHADSDSYHSPQEYTSFASTTSSISLSEPKPKALSDPFRSENIVRDVQVRMDPPPDFLLGQLSSIPVTQTTVVTTTRYTTTSFPPLVMKAPKHLEDLDPKMYPLASSPTPPSIKRFCMDVGGVPTVFREADNATEAFGQIQKQQKDLRASSGTLRSTTKYPPNLEIPKTRAADLGSQRHSKENTPLQSSTVLRQREASPVYTPTSPSQRKALPAYSPVSISEAARRAKLQPLSRQPSSTSLKGKPLGPSELRQNRSTSRLQILQTSTPITPSLSSRNVDDEQRGHAREGIQSSVAGVPDNSVTPEMESQEFQQTLSPQPEPNVRQAFKTNNSFVTEGSLGTGSLPRPRPSVLNTTAAQDASLPSPSLSPVTAAANLQSRMGYFEDAGPSVQSSPKDDPVSLIASGDAQSWKQGLDYSENPPAKPTDIAQEFRSASISDVPKMLDFFESMPTEMKTYIMYQLLRRCPKPVLHFVADNVNPALKCDFLSLLPPELCQNIIQHLDIKSLCRAAQVSKKWREVVDTDEKTWRNLFNSEGFDLAPGELERAILEGWGWQHASGPDDYEKDLSFSDSRGSSERVSPPNSSGDTVPDIHPRPEAQQCGQSRRSKRKVAPKLRTSSRKQLKKKEFETNEVALFDTESLKRHVASTDGPYAAAQAALLAVPMSNIGSPSLRTLHLHKSIYRRHHLISSNWMQDEVKPRHLAFKAHQRHVVTCLQFDADRILTGSDDTNINVYNTRTGALQARLEGHEGGVWALQYEGNTLVSGSTDRSVRVWDIEKGVCTHVFQGHTSTVRCLIILMPTMIGKTSRGKPIMMPKEPIIITGSRDSTLRVWKLPRPDDNISRQGSANQDDIESPYFLRALTGHVHSVRAIAAHGDTLVSGSYDSNVRVWKISTGETIHRLAGHAQKVYSVVLDHERNRCISGSMDNMVKIWSLDTGTVLFTLEGHTSLVGLLDLQRDRLVSAAADSTLRIWDPNTGQCKSTLRAHTGAITCFQHDGRKVISGSDRNLKMWDVKTGKFVRDLLTDLSGVWQVKFDERRCVAAVQRNSLTYIEVLDFGASRDGLSAAKRGRRIVVDVRGSEINETGDLPDDDVAVEE